ncbi:hypothetical protein K435DRAFT_842517 [Dendrothele bispora CBS 962.96]|uniref:Uncharacterized protein n=1 Tax=Dendrothele bispora (strain CBS 962.96) TaxID=1314807 RepID=A0A4V4HDK2_DENBC|nr:hypothetical protein K435DRAFT_842517 [Dendrothele bispora CBS 962.96]
MPRNAQAFNIATSNTTPRMSAPLWWSSKLPRLTTSKLDGNLSTFLPHSGVFQVYGAVVQVYCFLSGRRSSVITRPYPLTSFDKIYTLHNERHVLYADILITICLITKKV